LYGRDGDEGSGWNERPAIPCIMFMGPIQAAGELDQDGIVLPVAEGLIWKGCYREVSSVMRNPASRSQKVLSNSTLSYTSKDA
jgi:hypothetical protein